MVSCNDTISISLIDAALPSVELSIENPVLTHNNVHPRYHASALCLLFGEGEKIEILELRMIAQCTCI